MRSVVLAYKCGCGSAVADAASSLRDLFGLVHQTYIIFVFMGGVGHDSSDAQCKGHAIARAGTQGVRKLWASKEYWSHSTAVLFEYPTVVLRTSFDDFHDTHKTHVLHVQRRSRYSEQ